MQRAPASKKAPGVFLGMYFVVVSGDWDNGFVRGSTIKARPLTSFDVFGHGAPFINIDKL